MAGNISLSRFEKDFAEVLRTHPGKEDRFLARSALMWLCVAQRPLRAYEVWIALQVEGSKDTEHIESLLSEPGALDEAKAVSALQELLGGLIKFSQDGEDANATYVQLIDQELRTFLAHLSGTTDDASTLDLAFSTSQAHVFVASVCMVICSMTPLHLAHVHDDTIASTLVLYAWSFWARHLSLSGFTLANESAASLAESMVFGVLVDVLVFLLAVNDFVTGPITIQSTQDKLQCVAAVGRAQKALERPILLLTSLLQQQNYTKTLQGARRIFEASRYRNQPLPAAVEEEKADAASDASATTPLLADALARSASLGTSSSKAETLRIDRVLSSSLSLLGQQEKQTVLAFAETARGLRLVSVAIAQEPLYEEFLRQYSGNWSPLDILVHAADWFEDIASYPFSAEVASTAPYDPLDISDTSDESYEAAAFIKEKVRGKAGEGESQKPSPRTSKRKPAGISTGRWYAAVAIDKVTSLRSRGSLLGSTYTINDVRFLTQRTSSFTTVPLEMSATGDPLRFIYPFIPNSLRRFWYKRLGPFLKWTKDSSMFQSIDDFGSGAFTAGLMQTWPSVKAALVADGFRTAALHFGIAILLHQVRRTLFPWMGAYMYHEPIEELRLALSNPDAFLEQSLSYSWLWIAFCYGHKYAWDFGGAFLLGLLSINAGRLPPETVETLRDAPKVMYWFERAFEATRIGYIVWCLATAEYMFTRSVSTVAFVIAYGKLLAGGDAEHLALGAILKAHWTKLPLNAWQLFYYVRYGFFTMLWGSLMCAVVGQPGLLMMIGAVAGGVFAVLRWRSKLYMALELSGLFVVLGFAAIVAVLLGVEFAADPLGLKATTSILRKRASAARAVLPQEAGARVQILRAKAKVGGAGRPPTVKRPSLVEASSAGEAVPLIDLKED